MDYTALRLNGVNLTMTTIGAVVADAVLSRRRRITSASWRMIAGDAVLPTHLSSDGDTMFAAMTGEKPLENGTHLTSFAISPLIVMARVLARGVYEATTLLVDGAQ